MAMTSGPSGPSGPSSPSSSSTLHWRSVAEGAGLALAVTLPPVILVRILSGDDMDGQESDLWILAVLAIFAGFALGGYHAARRRPATGLTHAAAAAGVAFGAVAVYSVVRRLVTGDEITPATVVQLLLVGSITVSLAVLGGYVAVRRARARQTP